MHEKKSFSAPSALAGERYPTACRALAPTESQRSYWSRARARVTTTALNRGAKKGGEEIPHMPSACHIFPVSCVYHPQHASRCQTERTLMRKSAPRRVHRSREKRKSTGLKRPDKSGFYVFRCAHLYFSPHRVLVTPVPRHPATE